MINKPYNIIVIDNEKVIIFKYFNLLIINKLLFLFSMNFCLIYFILIIQYTKNSLFKLYADKSFDLFKDNLINTKFEEKLTHYEPKISKKLRIKDPSDLDVLNLIIKSDIKIDETYIFHKKLNPENLQNVSHLNFDLLLKNTNKNNKKYLIVVNEDEILNRNILYKADKLAKMNSNSDFFIITNALENKNFIKERFGVEFMTYPQLLILEGNDVKKTNDSNKLDLKIFPVNDLLSYKIDINSINEKLKNYV